MLSIACSPSQCFPAMPCVLFSRPFSVSGVQTVHMLQAAMLLRIAAMDPQQNAVAHGCGAVPALVSVLHHGPRHPVTLVALEALACLVTQNADGTCRVRSHAMMHTGCSALVTCLASAVGTHCAAARTESYPPRCGVNIGFASALEQAISRLIEVFVFGVAGRVQGRARPEAHRGPDPRGSRLRRGTPHFAHLSGVGRQGGRPQKPRAKWRMRGAQAFSEPAALHRGTGKPRSVQNTASWQYMSANTLPVPRIAVAL